MKKVDLLDGIETLPPRSILIVCEKGGLTWQHRDPSSTFYFDSRWKRKVDLLDSIETLNVSGDAECPAGATLTLHSSKTHISWSITLTRRFIVCGFAYGFYMIREPVLHFYDPPAKSYRYHFSNCSHCFKYYWHRSFKIIIRYMKKCWDGGKKKFKMLLR